MANAPCLVSLAWNARKCARKDLTFHKTSLMALCKRMCAVHYLNIIHLGFIGKFCSIFLIHCNLPHPQDTPFSPNPTDCPWVSEDEFTCNKGCFFNNLQYNIMKYTQSKSPITPERLAKISASTHCMQFPFHSTNFSICQQNQQRNGLVNDLLKELIFSIWFFLFIESNM